MSYIIGRWNDSRGEPRFVAWTEDEPGKMHEMMHKWMTTGATVEMLDFVPNDRKLPNGSRYDCVSRIMRWKDHLNNEEQD
jgi:hypothetical protein